jgi:ubiquinone/menaquinone biosynthesis C-methylase UbiE
VSEASVAGLFDGMAGTYDEDVFHTAVADALVAGLPAGPELLLDVAAGTGAAAFASLRLEPARVLAVDLSPGMIARAEAKARELDPDRRITWRVGPALPMPAADRSADAVLCASSLHFLGAAALRDWLRVLRPGGRAAFSLPSATTFRPSATFAALVPADLPLPSDEAAASALAVGAGFEDVTVRRLDADGERPRSVFLLHATAP